MERRLAVLLVCLLLLAASMAGGLRDSPPQPSGEGQVHVYLQPMPLETGRLTFTVGSASAVADVGAEVPLRLSFTTVRQADSGRQRLLASGRLPAGSYAGFSLKIEKASLRRDAGEVSLLVPDVPVRAASPFVVSRGRVAVIWLSFRRADSQLASAALDPVFSGGVAPLPISGRAGFVSNSGSDSITVFDKQLRQAAAFIPTCGQPSGMALDQRAGRLYVACSTSDEIQSIDVTSAEVVERSRLLPGDRPLELALSPDGRTLLSVNPGSNSVTFFDAPQLARLERVAVGNGPSSVVIDPAGKRAFVFNTLSNSISVVDIAQRTVAGTIAVDSGPLRGQFSGRGDRLFVIHERLPHATVIDPLQLNIVARPRLRAGVGAIRVDARRGLVYMGGPRDPLVEFYDPNTLLPINALRTKHGVVHLAIDAEDNALYMVSPDTSSLVVASLADRTVVSEIDVGRGPYWVAVMGER